MRGTSSLTLPWWFMLLFLIAKESSSAQPSLGSTAPTLTLWLPPTSANPQAARLTCGSEGPALPTSADPQAAKLTCDSEGPALPTSADPQAARLTCGSEGPALATSANPQAARLTCGSEGPALCSWFPWLHLWCYHLHTPVLDLTTHCQPWLLLSPS